MKIIKETVCFVGGLNFKRSIVFKKDLTCRLCGEKIAKGTKAIKINDSLTRIGKSYEFCICESHDVESAYEIIAKREGWHKFRFYINDVVSHRVWQKIPKLNKNGEIEEKSWFLERILLYIEEEFLRKLFGEEFCRKWGLNYKLDSKNGIGLITTERGTERGIFAFSLKYHHNNYDGYYYGLEIAKIDSYIVNYDGVAKQQYRRTVEFFNSVNIYEINDSKAKYKLHVTHSKERVSGTSIIKSYGRDDVKEYNFKTGELVTIKSKDTELYCGPLH